MTKKKAIIVGCSVAAAVLIAGGAAAGIAVACTSNNNEFKIEPTDQIYSPSLGYTRPAHAIDAGMKIDGVLNEAVYTADGHRWYNGVKIDGSERATLDFTTVFGEEGLYIAYDVTELTNRVYYNPVRDSFINSGIEMYLATKGTTKMESEGTFEIDMQCSGVLSIKKFILGTWKETYATDAITPVFTAVTKGGKYNTADCTGYTGELFMPYEFFVSLGLIDEGEKLDEVYVNPVLITSYGYDGTTQNDRNWYNTAGVDTDGDGWNNPSTFLHFNANGLVSYDINAEITGKGSVTTPKGYEFALKDNSLTLNVTAENGYTLDTLTINEENYKNQIKRVDGVSQIFIPQVTEDLNIKATFKEITGEKRLVKGNIVPDGINAATGISDMVVKLFDGFNYNELRTVNGSFAGNIVEGEYELYVMSKSYGYEIMSQKLTVDENLQELTLTVDDTMYGENSTVYFDGFTLASGGKTVKLEKPITSDRFVFEFGLGLGVDGAEFPADKYVEEVSLQTDNGDYICFQFLRWGGNFETKILLNGYDAQSFGVFEEEFSSFILRNKHLDFVLVRDDDVLTAYVRDESNNLKKLGEASLFAAIGSTPLTSYRLNGAEGVTPEYGIKLYDCTVYQGTTDLDVLDNAQ